MHCTIQRDFLSAVSSVDRRCIQENNKFFGVIRTLENKERYDYLDVFNQKTASLLSWQLRFSPKTLHSANREF
jgi:hypothetical protein